MIDVVHDHVMFQIFKDFLRFMFPVWIAFCVGMFAGWSWKPKFPYKKCVKSSKTLTSSSPATAPSPLPLSPKKSFGSAPCLYSLNYTTFDDGCSNESLKISPDSNTKNIEIRNIIDMINDADLEYLYKLVEIQDDGPSWIPMMEKTTSDMNYQAWRRDLYSGLPQYCSKTFYENISSELVRDFFWDDEFRLDWDDMLANASILEQCEQTGTMIVRWVRKFPFFCSDREYIIARRIWNADGGSYYCVTKGVNTLPRCDTPRRVDAYYSSWCIRPVGSSGNACEVILFHHEDMGIPWEIAKLGVRQGMWGTVKKIHRGIRAYQKKRNLNETMNGRDSRYVFMAGMNTKINLDRFRSFKKMENDQNDQNVINDVIEKSDRTNLSKFVVFGGVILIACSLDKAMMTKAIVFGIGRKFARLSGGGRT